MGGPYSSRWGMTVTRFTTEGLPRLDVRVLAREGMLRHGTSMVTWGNGATITLSIPTEAANEMHLAYDVQTYRGRVIPIQERMRLTRTPCTFGGTRVWFACPGCGARCAVLYALGGRFQCRQCHHLAYKSTRQLNGSARPCRTARNTEHDLKR